MTYKPIDSKRDQFRKYVENNGVVEMFSKALIELMNLPEKPECPIDFIRENLGATLKEKLLIEFLQSEVDAYRKEVADLKRQLQAATGIKQESGEAWSNAATSAITGPPDGGQSVPAEKSSEAAAVEAPPVEVGEAAVSVPSEADAPKAETPLTDNLAKPAIVTEPVAATPVAEEIVDNGAAVAEVVASPVETAAATAAVEEQPHVAVVGAAAVNESVQANAEGQATAAESN